MTTLGAGVVTFLFTDLVGSTALIDRLGDDAADSLRRDHFDVLRKALEDARGEEVKNLGDGLMVSFSSPVAALSCAVAMQRALASSEQRIRVGVHAGEPAQEGDDYFGTPVVIAKRLCDRAEGGQILATELLAGLVGTRGGFQFLPRGRLALKGLSEPVAAVEVRWQPDEAAAAPVAPTRRRAARASRPRGPGIVGRDHELAVLDDELAGAGDGELRCVLLSAEAGVGKTRLVREFLSRHDDVTPLSARAHPMGDTTAFGLWAEALDGHLRHLPATEVARCCGGFVEDLAAILRSVAAVRGSLPAAPPPRSALLEGITIILENLAADAPVVVVLDDIHQADASSLDALSYLAANLVDAPVLVVLTARPAELAEHPLANRVLLPLEQEGLLTRLPLAPLDDDELRALAASVISAPPPPALVQWLQARSRGNPLFALGLVRALLEEGADLAAPRLRRVPEDLADRVRALLATLEPRALTVLELLAVLGRPASIEELGTLSTKSPDDLSLSLDELIRHRTVSE
ncbi:MAG: AAA family ATPase, partial [Actinobacteria bacterium]|nr:AAA family ATPase [Actinomycetota bacterium]